MEENERSSKISPEIYVYATNKNFLNLYDALRIDKVKLEIAGYDPNTNRQTGHAAAWIDLDDARLLSHLVCSRQFAAVTGGTWEKYGGSQREDGNVESRTFQIEWDEAGGKFSKYPYRLTIANGPGKRTATGGVSPAGEPSSRLSMRLPELDMMKLMLALGDYIHAYEAAHHHRIVAQRVRELRDKLSERDNRRAGVNGRWDAEDNPRGAGTADAQRPVTVGTEDRARPAITPLRERVMEERPARVARAG
jgi:hypothetical protein